MKRAKTLILHMKKCYKFNFTNEKGLYKKYIPLVFSPCFCSIKTIIYTEQVIVDLPRLYIVHVLAGILCIRQNTKYLFCDFINFF